MKVLFDIGATQIRVAVSADNQIISNPIVFPTPQEFNQGITQIQQAALKLSQGQKIEAAAGGIPGPLNKQKNYVANFPNIADWNNKPLKQSLEQALGSSVFLENDASLVGLGEAVVGAGKNKKIVAYITVSTGVGGARIVQGKIDQKAGDFEIGHQIIVPNGSICGCQGLGHLEAYLSGSAIEKKYHQKPESIKDGAVWEEMAKFLAIGINNTIVYWSPEIIVLGGGVMKAISLDKVKLYLQEIFTIFPEIPPIELNTLGDTGGLYGALEYLKQNSR
ncbi:MAG: ROK family protein [Candidatus Daviesbacteria bacterium]|nr:MAG: ROK family protein [Candidatus Daviesbacteria bacterium]